MLHTPLQLMLENELKWFFVQFMLSDTSNHKYR